VALCMTHYSSCHLCCFSTLPYSCVSYRTSYCELFGLGGNYWPIVAASDGDECGAVGAMSADLIRAQTRAAAAGSHYQNKTLIVTVF
jgi:hypothetical protein